LSEKVPALFSQFYLRIFPDKLHPGWVDLLHS